MVHRREKDRVWKWLGVFLAGMVAFTLLSRAAYQHGLAVVSTASPTSGSIAHTLQVTGRTEQNQERAVTTVAGLRVASVRVHEGQQVAQGEVLFTLDLDDLEQTIVEQQQEMRKQQLSIQDAWSQSSASQKQRENQQAQAEENYDAAISQAQTTLERAARDLERAEQALEDFYSGVSTQEAREAALVQAAQEARNAYDAACTALEGLRQELADSIQSALDQATTETTGAGAGEDPVSPTPGQPDQEAITQAVEAEFASRIAQAEAAVEQARLAQEQADADLETFRQTPATEASEAELLANLEAAQQAYDDATDALENAQTVYGRAVASANLPEGTNHTAQIAQITYDQMALALGKLEALQEAEGEICAPVDGVVTRCSVQTGERTTDSTAMLLADLDQGCRFSCVITQEQSTYIGVGDLVTLQASSGGKRYEELAVTSLSSGEEEDTYRLTVQLPAGTLALGVSARLSYTQRSQPYTCCVPLSALHLDQNNRPYVLVAEETDSVLGTQLQARKVSVTVLEQNETMAALAEGALSSKQRVIVSSDKAVDTGSRVRVG